jgi:hypothetical protein
MIEKKRVIQTEHIPRKQIAEDILLFCKDHKKQYFTIKFSGGKIMCTAKKRPYTPNELAQGLTYAHRAKALERVSNNRWHVLLYALPNEVNNGNNA